MKAESKIVVWAAIAANVAIAIMKFIAAAFTGSSALLSEAIHSVVDTGNGGLLLVGMRFSRRPPDETHPFGHGKDLYFWSLIVAISIFGIGGGLSIYEGIAHLLRPRLMEDVVWNYWVLGFAAVFEGTSFGFSLHKMLRSKHTDESFWHTVVQSKDPAVYTVLFEDAAALIGLFIAFWGVWLGYHLKNPYFDGTASVGIGLLLAAAALFLAGQSRGLLVGESADPHQLRAIRKLAAADPDVVGVGRLLTMHLGPEEILLNLEIAFRHDLPSEKLETVIDRLERRIREPYPEIKLIFIEAESLTTRGAGPGRPGTGPAKQ